VFTVIDVLDNRLILKVGASVRVDLNSSSSGTVDLISNGIINSSGSGEDISDNGKDGLNTENTAVSSVFLTAAAAAAGSSEGMDAARGYSPDASSEKGSEGMFRGRTTSTGGTGSSYSSSSSSEGSSNSDEDSVATASTSGCSADMNSNSTAASKTRLVFIDGSWIDM
jgi:hypothetical protein